MAYFNSKKDKDGFYSNGYSDSWFSAKDGKAKPDEWFELDADMLETITGGTGQMECYDTYRYCRDQNGVLREIR